MTTRRWLALLALAWAILALLAILTHGDLHRKAVATTAAASTAASTDAAPAASAPASSAVAATSAADTAAATSAATTVSSPPPVLAGLTVRRGADGKVVLAGVVPDQATRKAIAARARRAYGADAVVDHLQVGASAAQGWSAAVPALVGTIAGGDVSGGALRATGKAVVVSGTVPSRAVERSVIGRVVAAVRHRLRVVDRLHVATPKPKAVQASLDAVLRAATVGFETGSAVLSAEGRRTLDRVVPILRGAPGARILIVGHTDAQGDAAANLALSQARAGAVKAYLAGHGVGAGRLTARGVGERDPIATNATPSGRAQNRRITMTVEKG